MQRSRAPRARFTILPSPSPATRLVWLMGCALLLFATNAYAGPVAAFSASPTSGPAPLTVTFSNTSTGNPTAWAWDFGDGAKSTDQNPVHTYEKVGEYTATLTVTDQKGNKGSDEIDIFVETEEGGGES